MDITQLITTATIWGEGFILGIIFGILFSIIKIMSYEECQYCGRAIWFRPLKIKKPMLEPTGKDGYYYKYDFIPYHKNCYIKSIKGVKIEQ